MSLVYLAKDKNITMVKRKMVTLRRLIRKKNAEFLLIIVFQHFVSYIDSILASKA